MPDGQLFVGRSVLLRHVFAAIALLLALLLGSCADADAEAQEQALVAEQLLAQGDPIGANRAITEAIRHRDDDPALYLLSARIKTAAKSFAQAYDAYQTVLALDPNNFEALVAVSVMASSAGDEARARDAMQRALALDPNQLDVLMSMGTLELREKNYPAAAALAERIIAAHPSDPTGYVLKSRVLALKGDDAGALAILRDVVERLGNSVMVSTVLLESARAQGDVATMREQYALIASERPDSSELALDEINLLYKIGDTAAARRAGTEVLRRFGGDGEALKRLHELWSEYDREPVSEADVATLRDSGQPEAKLMVARFLLDQGALDAAGALVAGGDLRAAGLGARIAIRQGNAGAANGARAILKEDTTNCEALAAVAEWELSRRRLEEAIRAAQVVAAQCTDRIDGYLLQARAYELGKRPAAVERVYREGIEAHPASPELTRRFADWLLGKGRGDAAVAITGKLTKVAPHRNSSWRLYGDVCRRAGKASCITRAAQGLAAARKDYRLEIHDIYSASNTLLGKQWN